MERFSYRIILLLLLAALCAPLLPAQVAHAATLYYVGTLSDDDGTNMARCAIPENTDCSLRSAIAAATSGSDTIVWNANLAVTLVLTHGQLEVSHAVRISGPGANVVQISGDNASRVFFLDTLNRIAIAIDSLTIQSGLAIIGAGIVLANGGKLTLTDCVVTGNTVATNATSEQYYGGGITADGDLTLIRTTVSNNKVLSLETSGGAVDLRGGGIMQLGGTLTLTASTVSGNTVQVHPLNTGSAIGGGIDNQGAAVITGSTLSGNQVISPQGSVIAGGGLANINGVTTVTNSTLSGNAVFSAQGTLGGKGGGIYNTGTLALNSVTVSGNSAARGGGMSDGTITLTDSLIALNSDTAGNPDVASVAATGASRNNLISIDGTGGISGICDGTNSNQIGTPFGPINPRLDPNSLQANGGSPETIALHPNSPAIDAGGACPDTDALTDQRGRARVGACDIGAYEYQPVIPTVQGATAPVSGGNGTFRGTGFQAGTRLTIAGTTATATGAAVSDDGTRMTLAVPAHAAGAAPFTMTNPGNGHTATGTLIYTPIVASLSPASGGTVGGAAVTITGTGFVPGNTSVTFGTAPATVANVTATTVTVTAPAHVAGMVDVTVTANGASGTKTGAYTYGTVNALPNSPTQVSGGQGNGNPAPIPGARPTVTPPQSGSPNPLPPGR
jgi:hypothetical protein